MLFSVFNALGPISNPTPSYCGVDRVFPCRYRDERPSIASFVIFDIFGVRASVFLYAYYVNLMFYGTLPFWELNTLAKESMAATHVMKSSSDKLSTLVTDSAKYKQTKAKRKYVLILQIFTCLIGCPFHMALCHI